VTPDDIRRHATEIILGHARDVEFLSIAEYLAGEDVDDPDDETAKVQRFDERHLRRGQRMFLRAPSPSNGPAARVVADVGGEAAARARPAGSRSTRTCACPARPTTRPPGRAATTAAAPAWIRRRACPPGVMGDDPHCHCALSPLRQAGRARIQ
jgi:hypothetical protein